MAMSPSDSLVDGASVGENAEGSVRGPVMANNMSRILKYEVEDVERPWDLLRQLMYPRRTMQVPLLKATTKLVNAMSQLLSTQMQITFHHTHQTRREFPHAHNHQIRTRQLRV